MRRSINIFRYFAGEGSRLFGIRAVETERVYSFASAEAGVGGGLITPLELPERYSGVETRAGSGGREHGGAEAGVSSAVERMADRGSAAEAGVRRAW